MHDTYYILASIMHKTVIMATCMYMQAPCMKLHIETLHDTCRYNARKVAKANRLLTRILQDQVWDPKRICFKFIHGTYKTNTRKSCKDLTLNLLRP